MRLELPRDPTFVGGVWYSTSASSWYPAHHHEELEVKLVVRGTTRYAVGSETLELVAGTLLFLPPQLEHDLLETSPELGMWVLSFRLALVESVQARSGVTLLTGGPVAVRLSTSLCRSLSSQAADAHCAATAADQNPCMASWLEAAANCQRVAPRQSAQPVAPLPLHPAVRRTLAAIEGSEDDESLAALAGDCSLSPARLSRLFKEHVGLSLVQYKNHRRVQRFIRLFGNGEQQTMLASALSAGFGSYPQFHRAFRQVVGYAPQEHLQRVRLGIVEPAAQGEVAKRRR